MADLASKNPTPGGGSVAAVAGALAAALVEMVANLSKDDRIKDMGDESKKLRNQLLKLADQDCRAFEAVMDAYKSKDKTRLKKALLGAIDIPEETKKLTKQVQKMAIEASKFGNKNALSDSKTAIYLCTAAVKSAQENININKEALKKLEP